MSRKSCTDGVLALKYTYPLRFLRLREDYFVLQSDRNNTPAAVASSHPLGPEKDRLRPWCAAQNRLQIRMSTERSVSTRPPRACVRRPHTMTGPHPSRFPDSLVLIVGIELSVLRRSQGRLRQDILGLIRLVSVQPDEMLLRGADDRRGATTVRSADAGFRGFQELSGSRPMGSLRLSWDLGSKAHGILNVPAARCYSLWGSCLLESGRFEARLKVRLPVCRRLVPEHHLEHAFSSRLPPRPLRRDWA